MQIFQKAGYDPEILGKESFFGHIKDELELKHRNRTSFSQVQADIDAYITTGFYPRQ